jgi:hypothetical protein
LKTRRRLIGCNHFRLLLRRPPHSFGLSPVSLTVFWERASGPTALSLCAVAEDAGSHDTGDCEGAWMGLPVFVTAGRIRGGKTAMFGGRDTDLTAGDSNGVLSVSLSDLGLMGIVT